MSEQAFLPPADWRAWVWEGGNSPKDLQERYISMQPLKPDEVLVQNMAIGLNPVDWKVLSTQFGQVPGVDGSGFVVAVGDNVNQSLLGARVAYHQNLERNGSFAEFIILQAQVLMRVPDSIDFATAAAFPCPALTAWQSIEKIPTQPGARLLIAGAGGSVGHFLVQLAHARGFEITTLSSERHWSRLRALGANRCLDELPAESERYLAVIDAVSPENAMHLSNYLQANGHLVCIQGRVPHWPSPAFGRALSLHEVALGALHQHGDSHQWHALTQQGERMLAKIANGDLQTELLLHFSYDQLPTQLFALQERNFTGKQVILL